MTAEVRLTRTWSSFVDRTGDWQVLIDGDKAGSIAKRQTVELPVEPGQHTLRVRSSGRFRSPERSFDIADGQEFGFHCHGQRYWPLMLASLVKPDLWITLRRD